MSYKHAVGSLETEAFIKSNSISQLISANPAMWEFEQVRLEAYISKSLKNMPPESQRIYNTNNELIAENSVVLKPPVITQSAELFDSGVVVGSIEILSSLYPILKQTVLIMLVALPVGLIGFLILRNLPIRHLHKIEDDLKISEEKNRNLIEAANDAIFTADAETGIILNVNQRGLELMGMPAEEIIGMHQLQLHPQEEQEKYKMIFKDAVRDKKAMVTDIFISRKDGRKIPVEVSSSVTELKGRIIIQGIFRDITERKMTQEAIRDSEARYSEAAKAAHLGHWQSSIIDDHLYWSAEMYSIFGVDPNKFDPSFYNFYSLVHNEDKQPLRNLINASVSRKIPFNAEYRIIRPDGGMRTIRSKADWQYSEKSESLQLVGTAQDITDQKQAEAALLWADQLNIIAEVTKGLAEGIKNSLAGIKASVEVLIEKQDIPEDDKLNIRRALDEIYRINKTLSALLRFARPSKPALLFVNINDVLDQAIEFSLKQMSLSLDVYSKIMISKNLDKSIPEILADPMQVQQIFLNLIFNAIDSMPDGGTISFVSSYVAETNCIQIMISDTGRGIDQRVKDKIFQPFYTTKKQGTGLGLSITRRILDQHGGDICVDNNPQGGTVFYVSLPAKVDS